MVATENYIDLVPNKLPGLPSRMLIQKKAIVNLCTHRNKKKKWCKTHHITPLVILTKMEVWIDLGPSILISITTHINKGNALHSSKACQNAKKHWCNCK
jgi:hypothetical protein